MAAGDSEQLAQSLQTLSLSDQAGKKAKQIAPRTNFPLPRELRDEIFGYLLHHEHVREKPYYARIPSERSKVSSEWMLDCKTSTLMRVQLCDNNKRENSSAYTYHFHTNILAVNKQIRDEALRTLRSNRFIVVSYLWPGLATLKHNIGVPIVTESPAHVARFDQHVLHIHCRAPTTTKVAKIMVESFLIVTDQLPTLCTFLRLVHSSLFSPAPFVTQTSSDMPRTFHMTTTTPEGIAKQLVPAILIQIKDRPEGQDFPQVTEDLLQPLGAVVHGMQDVSFLNVGTGLAVYTDKLRQMMGPGMYGPVLTRGTSSKW